MLSLVVARLARQGMLDCIAADRDAPQENDGMAAEAAEGANAQPCAGRGRRIMRRIRRDPMRIYDLLRRLHPGTEDELAEWVVRIADAAAVRADAIVEDMPSSAPIGSPEWRRNRAKIVSVIVSAITRYGRSAVLMPDSVAALCEPDGDRVEPGNAEGEDEGRPMRYDLIYMPEVVVSLGCEEGAVRYPPFDGRVRVERRGARATVMALDDLAENDRRTLVSRPVRRRVELHARCAVRRCGRSFRGWLNATRMTVEDTKGETICALADLCLAKCDMHKDRE